METVEVIVTEEDLMNSCRTSDDVDARHKSIDDTVCTTCILAEAIKRSGLMPDPYVSPSPWKIRSKKSLDLQAIYDIVDPTIPIMFDRARLDDVAFEELRKALPAEVSLKKC